MTKMTPDADDDALWPERLLRPGAKRVLAIDGGGIRGALAVGILQKLEAMLRRRFGRPDLLLSDYFDLIGGTSTGAIIAAGLALGKDTAYLEKLYRELGPRVFHNAIPRFAGVQARFDPRRLEAVLRHELGDVTLGGAPWRTGFAAIAKRVDTSSTWVLTNCPRAKFWDGDPDEIAREPDPLKRRTVPNKDYSLATVVQASAAAPFYFDMVPIEVVAGDGGVFFDGAMTPHANPSLQLAMSAVIPAYGFGWTAGADNLLIVSVGTGWPKPVKPEWRYKPRLLSLWKTVHALTSLSYDTSQHAIAALQWLGANPQPWRINSEVGTLEDALPGIAPLWTFLRFDAPLEAAWLKQHLNRTPAPAILKRMAKLADDTQVPALFEVGQLAGEAQITDELFPTAFDI